MSVTVFKRNYRMTDSELCLLASNFNFILERDLSDMIPFGLSQLKIDGLKAKGDAFEVYHTDEYSRGMQGIATEDKDITTLQLKDAIWQMAWRIETKWGKDSKQYRLLGFNEIYNQPDDSILRIGRHVHDILTQLQPQLVELGLTTEALEDYLELTNTYETALNDKQTAVVERDDNAQVRINMGNELYKEIVTYAELGKKLYGRTNPAKYNDYVIYDSFSAGTMTAPENLSVDVATMTFTWSSVENSTSYQLLTSIAGDIWVEVYAGPDNFVMYVPPSSGLAMYKVKPRSSSGYGPESAIMYYNYQAVIAPPGYISLSVINANTGAVALNWEEVASAEFYRLFQSQVAIGTEVPGVYTLVGEYTTASYSGNVPTGYRYWFYVISGSSEEMLSVASDAVYVDMQLIP